jgi:hypothetical protein
MSSLKELNSRLTQLEKGNNNNSGESKPSEHDSPTSDFITQLEVAKKDKQTAIMTKVEKAAENQAKFQGVNVSNLLDVVSFVVTFVENVSSYVPEVLELVGGMLTGSHKYGLALQIIAHFVGDVGSVVSSVTMKDLINHTVDLKFNQTKNPDGTVTTEMSKKTVSHSEVNKGGKKKCFPFGSKASKKET